MKLRFVSSDQLSGRVREELSSFDSAGLIDEGLFYSKIKKGLGDLGLSVKQPAEVILYPDHFKSPLPEDLVEFYALYRLKATGTHTRRRILSDRQYYRETDQCEMRKRRCCQLEVEGTFVREKIIVEDQIEDECVYHNHGLLRYVSRGPFRPGGLAQCYTADSPCRHHRSPHEFSEDGVYFHFNFTEDPVLVQYHAFPLEDGLPMVPDEPVVQDFLEKKLVYETLRKIYYNGESNDLERRLQLAEKEFGIAWSNAQSWTKMPSFQKLLEYTRQQRKTSVFDLYESMYQF